MLAAHGFTPHSESYLRALTRLRKTTRLLQIQVLLAETPFDSMSVDEVARFQEHDLVAQIRRVRLGRVP